ncbi:MAG: hypothetical protein ACK55Q_10505 [Dolichospermum sp.]|jgi:hypothetical protein
MVIADSNRGSHFYLEIELPNMYGIEVSKVEQLIETNIDVILANMTATGNVYKFKSSEKYVYMFSTKQRKRNGQLIKLVERMLVNKEYIDGYQTAACLKSEFSEMLSRMKLRKSFKLVAEPTIFDGYSAKDLEVFKNKDNWYPWQKEIYQKLFFNTDTIREPNPREIIALYDKDGNAGKSSFFKYLFYYHSDEIGRVTYGTSSQLRSALVNIGPKKIYIIDLTRAKGKHDNEVDLLSAIEDLKGGVVSTNMFGSGNTMLMDIPHIVISSNYIFDQNLLSKDRWKIYAIKNQELINITEKIKTQELTLKLEEDKQKKDKFPEIIRKKQQMVLGIC